MIGYGRGTLRLTYHRPFLCWIGYLISAATAVALFARLAWRLQLRRS
jgi:hypothetical protein